MAVKLKWITPDTDKMIAHMARVSNPKAQEGDPASKLINYLLKHKHYSPFEMACMCVEIETTRDVSRQILRHRSFHFQEFSQRYSEVPEEPEFSLQARLQDPKNRQNSVPVNDSWFNEDWLSIQSTVWTVCWAAYKGALAIGVAKELARKLLPEGLVRTRMYMQGTIRDWLHYVAVRSGPDTQLEHRVVATEIGQLLSQQCPEIYKAALKAKVIDVQ